MMLSRLIVRNIKKNMRKYVPEEYLEIEKGEVDNKYNSDIKNSFDIKVYKKSEVKRGLGENENPIPISPILGPIEISKVDIGENKLYRWCSCGMSLKQPFCDMSHKGTKFFPIKFKIEQESVDKIYLCGCKLSSKKPFCDGETCKNLSKPN